ncbi:hypothetical protein BSFP_058670 [Burkholderia stabilis]|uniref:Uncharacterized protein n=1 Tax=Burkholderia stabilis TaxID=95485 RepID=A0A1Y1BXJ0_9BURK|nr:hypothetical protein BSFP_058670 [Burkholderia stabilis]
MRGLVVARALDVDHARIMCAIALLSGRNDVCFHYVSMIDQDDKPSGRPLSRTSTFRVAIARIGPYLHRQERICVCAAAIGMFI